MSKRENKPTCSYLLSEQEAPAHVNTVFGNVVIGTILSYQLNDLREDTVLFSCDRPPDQVCGKENELKNILPFPDLPKTLCTATPFAPPSNLPSDQARSISKLNDLDSARHREKTTVKQSLDANRFVHRKFRLTASNFGFFHFHFIYLFHSKIYKEKYKVDK